MFILYLKLDLPASWILLLLEFETQKSGRRRNDNYSKIS